MSLFRLPDLGEGLQDAEIHRWLVQEGDIVRVDQPLVSVETAKAVMDLPSPQAGTIHRLFGRPGDTCKVGEPLVEFSDETTTVTTPPSTRKENDQGTVVGYLDSERPDREDRFFIGTPPGAAASQDSGATPKVRALARQLGVPLGSVNGSGPQGQILARDVEAAADQQRTAADPPSAFSGGHPLKGVRRQMAVNLAKAHSEVAAVTLFDEVDVEHWPIHCDVTVRLVRALVAAAAAEPSLNAWYDSTSLRRLLHQSVDIGIATDTPEGLFVPVLRNAEQLDDATLREQLDALHQAVLARTLPLEALQGATLTLSNFGGLAGRYATPLVVPPTVCILGAGRIRPRPAALEDKLVLRHLLPLSLTFDHRAVTGAEAARFFQALMNDLGDGA